MTRRFLIRPIGRRFCLASVVLGSLFLGCVTVPPALASSLPAAPARPLCGVAVDENGQPLSSARIWLVGLNIGYQANVDDPKPIDKTTTDRSGRFRLGVPESWFATAYAWRPDLGVVAYVPGRRVAGLLLKRSSPPQSVRLALQPATQASFRLLQHDGAGAAGCDVAAQFVVVDVVGTAQLLDAEAAPPVAISPVRRHDSTGAVADGWLLGRDLVALPSELRTALAARTDARGDVRLPDIAASDLAGVGIRSAGQDAWEYRFFSNPWLGRKEFKPWPATLKLQPLYSVQGKLTAKAGLAPPSARIRVRSTSFSQEMAMWWAAATEATLDRSGAFRAALPTGFVSASMDLPGCFVDGGAQISEGEVPVLAFTVQRLTEVHGQARAEGTRRPLSGVRLVTTGLRMDASGPVGTIEMETDSAGRFTFLATPGHLQWKAIFGADVPALCTQEAAAFTREIPQGVERCDLPPLDLPTYRTVDGTVADEAGHAAAGAIVTAIWMRYNNRTDTMEPQVAQARTDAGGHFEFPKVIRYRAMKLAARHGTACCKEPLVLRPSDPARSIALKIVPGKPPMASGRVVDEEGHPCVNVRVELWWRPAALPWLELLPEPAKPLHASVFIPEESVPLHLGAAAESEVLLASPPITDADGRFNVPLLTEPDAEYQAVVRRHGSFPARTAWKSRADGPKTEWPDLYVSRAQPLQGRVVDRQGSPVSGATVVRGDSRTRVTTSTDADGHFKLEIVLDDVGFLFVEAAGFRFHGELSETTRPVQVTLVRHSEPVAASMRSLPWEVSHEERFALAQKFLAPQINRALASDNDGDRLLGLSWVGFFDPARCLEILELKPMQGDWHDGFVRRSIAGALRKQSIEEARTVVESMRDPMFRVVGYFDLLQALPPTATRDERRDLLAQALVHARAIKDGDSRAAKLAHVGESLLQIGDTEESTRLLREAHEIVRHVSTSGLKASSRASVAAYLASVDLPAALELLRGLKDPGSWNTEHGNLAHRIARIHPAEAERVLGMMKDKFQRDQYAPRVCYRMATVDLKRAQRIADSIEEAKMRAYAFGVMAQALAPTNKPEATSQLTQAYAILAQGAAKQEDDFNNFISSASLAGMLLRVAEEVDPSLLPELFWRAVSFRVPRLIELPTDVKYPRGWIADAALAFPLARYNRKVAAVLLDQATPWLTRSFQDGGTKWLQAAVLIRPHESLRVFEQLPRTLRSSDYWQRVAASLLVRDEDRLWRQVYGDVMLWWPDQVNDD